MQMALPTQQPLNWLQRFVAWLFRIDTRQQIIQKAPVYIKGGSPVQFSVVTEPITSREWRPDAQPQASPPKRQSKPITRKPHRKNMDPKSLYEDVAQYHNWDDIVAKPNWYRIYKLKNSGEYVRKRWQLEIHAGNPLRKIKQRAFTTQDQASKYVVALINTHFDKQGAQ